MEGRVDVEVEVEEYERRSSTEEALGVLLNSAGTYDALEQSQTADLSRALDEEATADMLEKVSVGEPERYISLDCRASSEAAGGDGSLK